MKAGKTPPVKSCGRRSREEIQNVSEAAAKDTEHCRSRNSAILH